MKSLITLAVLVLISLVKVKAQLALTCEIEESIRTGTNSVYFVLSPDPLEVVELAGLSESKSAKVLIDLLSSDANPAVVVSNQILEKLPALLKTISPLKSLKIPTCRFKWIANQLFCDDVPSEVLEPLCSVFAAITKIAKPFKLPLPRRPVVELTCEKDPRWGLNTVKVPEVWNTTGYRGAGVIVANLDTGVRGSHEELKDNRRANFSWFDAYKPANPTPVDNEGHGTHTMGTVCGKTVGVAPDAQWIACKGCESDGCENEQVLDCGQWLMCPDNRTQDCVTKPHVINNSWGGGSGSSFYLTALGLMKQVGIINIFGSGNAGPACGTTISPADANGTKWGMITVGAMSCDENIGSYSSVGPSKAPEYVGKLGINLVAPGTNIFSAWNTGDTVTKKMSGTSMACPHVTGATAVLLSKNLNLTVDQIRTALQASAFRQPKVTSSFTTCSTSDTSKTGPWPNNVYGHGRLDMSTAMNAL